jgi:glycine oxidase
MRAVAPYNNCMTEHPDVLIIGGGVIGLTTAYYLAREQVRVTIVDKGDFGQEASWAGAGIVPPGNPGRARAPFDVLRAHSCSLFPGLSAELRERTGIDNGYLRCGGLEIADEVAGAHHEWRSEGIAFQTLAEVELLRLEPALARGLGTAYHLPDMAQIRNPRHLKALIAGCAAHGVRLRPGRLVHALERQNNRITGAMTSEGRISADRIILATGAWSDALLQPLGWQPGIRPVRGQIALLHPEAPLFHRIVVRGKLYLVPRPDGRVLVGSTEEDVGFDKRTTASAVRNLLAFAVVIVPGLAEAPLERCWAGLRPGTLDELPYLGPVPGLDNLFVAAGHFRSGIQLSPGTGLLLKELLLGQELTVPIEPYRLDREPVPPQSPTFRS